MPYIRVQRVGFGFSQSYEVTEFDLGANVVAEAFVRGLICGGSALAKSVNALGNSVPSKFYLLRCLKPNTTVTPQMVAYESNWLSDLQLTGAVDLKRGTILVNSTFAEYLLS
jgi:hypothetical protein